MLKVPDLDGAPGVADPWDGGAGEIERVVVEIQNDLYDVGVHDVARDLDRRRHGRHYGLRLVQQGRYRDVDGRRIKQRLVTLHIYEHFAIDVGGYFGDPLGAGAMVVAGHARLAAEGGHDLYDAVVVGGHDHPIDTACRFSTFVHSLNHGLSIQGHQRLAGQARGTVARWYYYYDFVGTHGQVLSSDRCGGTAS